MPELNKKISDKLIDKNIEFKNFSENHDDIVNFKTEPLSWVEPNKVAQKLFSFLLENFMHRYLFNLMLRKSPNIASWALNDKDLIEKNLKKYSFDQSFIRLYKCYDCQYILKRIYAPELSSVPTGDIAECPACGLKKLIYPNDYHSNFIIIPNDLTYFIESLRDIGVVHVKEYVLCSKCHVELGSKDELSGMSSCQLCGGEIVYKKRDEFKEDFLNLCKAKTGLWFEWFVYEIAKHVYENVECGLNLSYLDGEGNNKEKEVDIIALHNDRLILIECKDFIDHTPPREYQTIIDISPFFDEVYVVNFYKPHSDVVKKMISSDSNIKVLDGNKLDEVFLNNDLIISQLLTADPRFGAGTIARISKDKQISVIRQIFKNFSDRNMIKALVKIIDSRFINLNLWWTHFSRELEKALDFELKQISKVRESGENISDSLKLVSLYYHNFDKEELSKIFNPSQVLNSLVGVNKLASDYDSEIRTIYDRFFQLYEINDFDLAIISNDILFDQIFDDLYYTYFENYSWRKRVTTLSWMSFIFEKISDTKVHSFSQLIEREFKNPEFHSGTVADSMFAIFSEYELKFGKPEKLTIAESAKYLNENGINDFVKYSATRFIDKISAPEL